MTVVRSIVFGTVIVACPFVVHAQEETPAPPTEPPPLTEEEQQKLLEALSQDAATKTPNSPSTAAGLPDLSQVNLGSALPQALQSMNPDISVLFNGTASWFSVDEPLQTGEHDPDRTGFKLQQIEMQIGASVDPFARFDSNIVFKGDEVEVEEAYATSTSLPLNLQLRGGSFLTHVGRTNEQHPHVWNFVDQPIVYGKLFGPDNSRGLGGEVSWLTPLPWYTNVFVTVQDAVGECCSRTFAPVGVLTIRSPGDLVYSAVVEQFFPATDDLSIFWGLSAMEGPGTSVDDGARAEIVGTDLMVRYAPVNSETRWALTWTTELFGRTRRTVDDALTDGGGLTQLIWRINPQFDVGGRFELLQALPDDPLDPVEEGLRSRSSVEGSFYPSHFSRFRVQGSVDVPTWEATPIYAVMFQLEVDVGAHGAHAY